MPGSKERQRRLARERFERQQQRRAERARKIRQRTVIGGSAVAVVAIAVGAYFLFGTSSSKPSASATTKPSASSSASASPSASTVALPATGPLATVPKGAPKTPPAKHCTYKPNPPAARNVGTPPAKPDSSAKSQATIVTNRGTVVIDLLNSRAPCTVNSFTYLASKGYFDNTPCPRLVTSGIYVLQCGDPTGTGSGGPGYEFANENTAGATYPSGTLAMANAGAGTNGSQFFIVYAPGGLSPSYTPFGVVVKGLDIVRKIAEAGTRTTTAVGGGEPNKKVTIEKVKISSY